jgi:hypothetical protein
VVIVENCYSVSHELIRYYITFNLVGERVEIYYSPPTMNGNVYRCPTTEELEQHIIRVGRDSHYIMNKNINDFLIEIITKCIEESVEW